MFTFRLPDIGEGLSEGELLEWHVKIGERVRESQDVASISTDKVAVTLTAPRAGIIVELPWEPGAVIAVGAVLMRIDDGADTTSLPTTRIQLERSHDANRHLPGAAEKTAAADRGAVKAAPAVRAYAKARGVNLAELTPSGASGDILRKDVDAFLARRSPAAGQVNTGFIIERLTGAGLVAADHLFESIHSLATATITFEVAAREILRSTQLLNDEPSSREIKIGPLAVIAFRVAAALGKYSRFNATLDNAARELHIHSGVHLGIAVDTKHGLTVPVIRDVQAKRITQVADEIAALAQRARSNKLQPAEVRGSTFTISSTGGIEKALVVATTPIINLPNVATLWVSRIRERPHVHEGSIVAAPLMSCSLSFDHRFIHGAAAVEFMAELETQFQRTDVDLRASGHE